MTCATGSILPPGLLPKGEYGADNWIADAATVDRVRQLYPTKEQMNSLIEQDRKGFLATMGKIQNAMVLGVDKNIYVEPVIWTVEYAQREKYPYPDLGDL